MIIPTSIPSGSAWHHIFLDRYPDPLGFGFAASRFSDPRKRRHRFGVYYVGETFEVAFLETLLRDRKNGNPDRLLLDRAELADYAHVEIAILQPLDVVDLRGGNAIALGLPTDAIGARSHAPGRRASLEFYQHPKYFDGIAYPSRLNGDSDIAVYDRAIPKLSAGPRQKLDTHAELAAVLDAYRVVLV